MSRVDTNDWPALLLGGEPVGFFRDLETACNLIECLLHTSPFSISFSLRVEDCKDFIGWTMVIFQGTPLAVIKDPSTAIFYGTGLAEGAQDAVRLRKIRAQEEEEDYDDGDEWKHGSPVPV